MFSNNNVQQRLGVLQGYGSSEGILKKLASDKDVSTLLASLLLDFHRVFKFRLNWLTQKNYGCLDKPPQACMSPGFRARFA